MATTVPMGLLTIQFGQCGNQIGHALLKYIINDITDMKAGNSEYTNLTKELWFTGCNNLNYVPRSILVDTENKVVSSLVKNNDFLKYQHVIAKNAGGSANNWAFGYTEKSKNLIDDVIQSARKEFEKSDSITHILSFLSSGGGTGSGAGSRILESLRNEFPNKIILNAIVLPYKKGEVVTQSYNTLLTLAKLHDITDGNIILENDVLHKICSSSLSIENVDLCHINNLIAKKLCSVFQPAVDYSVYNLVSHLMTHPCYKFVQIKTNPHVAKEYVQFESLPTWSSLVGQMIKDTSRALNVQSPKPKQWKSLASLLISRGGSQPDDTVWDSLALKELYPTWIVGDKIKHYHQPKKLYETERYLALASNSNSIFNSIDYITNQAWNLYKHKAYLHQYSKYGIGESEFNNAFEKLEFVLNNYKEL